MTTTLRKFKSAMKNVANQYKKQQIEPQIEYDLWISALPQIEQMGIAEYCTKILCDSKPVRLVSTFSNMDNFRHFLKCEKNNLRQMKMIQKFYVHAHNLNLDECKKYHKKIQDNQSTVMDELQDGDKTIAVYDDGNIELVENDNAFLLYCDESLRHYNYRLKIIKYLLLRLLKIVKKQLKEQ